jgi:hypothetical protein
MRAGETMRPTPKQIKEARVVTARWLTWKVRGAAPSDDVLKAMETLLAATEPPTDEDIAEFAANHRFAMGIPASIHGELAKLRGGHDDSMVSFIRYGVRHFLGTPSEPKADVEGWIRVDKPYVSKASK